MASVSGPSNPVNQPIAQQPAATGPAATPKSNEVAQAPAAAAPQQAQTAFEGQAKRPSGEKLGAAVAGPNVPLPSMNLGGAQTSGPVSLKSPAGQQFVQDANTALAGQRQSIAPTGAGFVAKSVE